MSLAEYNCVYLRRLPWLRCGAAVLSGLLLSAAFAPLEWSWCAFIALVPLLVTPLPKRNIERFGVGFLFGYTHFATSLHWLNAVGFGAGWLLALYCALYPMIWYWLISYFAWRVKPVEILAKGDKPSSAPHAPGARLAGIGVTPWRQFLVTMSVITGWTALEWLRSWVFTGFPWNLIATSQAFAPLTRQCLAVVGPFGLGTLIIAVNTALALVFTCRHKCLRQPVVWLAVLMLIGCVGYGRYCATTQPAPITKTFQVMAVQGDLPECRAWNDEIYEFSWERYASLTRDGVAHAAQPLDLVVWPEGTLPCAINFPRYASDLRGLLQELNGVPLLMGAIDFRPVNYQVLLKDSYAEEDFNCYNSAFLLTAQSPVLLNPSTVTRTDYYDKIHLVPFGEYVPFSKYFPWLPGIIGMGRDMASGKNYTLFTRNDVRFGVTICFEDVFPAISRQFMRNGADFLMTITNDCWYPHSSEAHQHLAHAVMRAVENRAVLLRSGNNSDTCLILPDGTISTPIRNAAGGQYGSGVGYYTIALPQTPQLSIYCKYGDWPAWLCMILIATITIALRKQK
jgi:apolipoprotein N-acyltransferase